MKRKMFVLAVLSLFTAVSYAESELYESEYAEDANEEMSEEEFRQFLMTDSIYGQNGVVNLDDAHAVVNVPVGFQYIDASQANRLLSVYWGNIDDDALLGGLIPDTSKIYVNVPFIFTVYYNPCGYVSDSDADDIDADDVAETIRKSNEKTNEKRREAGLSTLEFVGWADEPRYDKNLKVICYAKHFVSSKDTENEVHSMNYEIDVLGKSGYVILNAVADYEDKDMVVGVSNDVVKSIAYADGYKYTDFDSTKDLISDISVGGLVAGGLLAKTGFFAKIGVLLLKFWKLVVALFVGIGALVAKVLKGKKRDEDGRVIEEEEKPVEKDE